MAPQLSAGNPAGELALSWLSSELVRSVASEVAKQLCVTVHTLEAMDKAQKKSGSSGGCLSHQSSQHRSLQKLQALVRRYIPFVVRNSGSLRDSSSTGSGKNTTSALADASASLAERSGSGSIEGGLRRDEEEANELLMLQVVHALMFSLAQEIQDRSPFVPPPTNTAVSSAQTLLQSRLDRPTLPVETWQSVRELPVLGTLFVTVATVSSEWIFVDGQPPTVSARMPSLSLEAVLPSSSQQQSVASAATEVTHGSRSAVRDSHVSERPRFSLSPEVVSVSGAIIRLTMGVLSYLSDRSLQYLLHANEYELLSMQDGILLHLHLYATVLHSAWTYYRTAVISFQTVKERAKKLAPMIQQLFVTHAERTRLCINVVKRILSSLCPSNRTVTEVMFFLAQSSSLKYRVALASLVECLKFCEEDGHRGYPVHALRELKLSLTSVQHEVVEEFVLQLYGSHEYVRLLAAGGKGIVAGNNAAGANGSTNPLVANTTTGEGTSTTTTTVSSTSSGEPQVALGEVDQTPLIGLRNLGNTCYVNSTLQALHRCLAFRNEVIEVVLKQMRPGGLVYKGLMEGAGPGQLLCTLVLVLAEMGLHFRPTPAVPRQRLPRSKQQRRPSLSPDLFVKLLPEPFRGGGQHDASEFCKTLLGTLAHLHEEAKRTSPPPATLSHRAATTSPTPPVSPATASDNDATLQHVADVVHRYFGGKTATSYVCQECGYVSTQVETQWDLPLPLSYLEDSHHSQSTSSSKVVREPAAVAATGTTASAGSEIENNAIHHPVPNSTVRPISESEGQIASIADLATIAAPSTDSWVIDGESINDTNNLCHSPPESKTTVEKNVSQQPAVEKQRKQEGASSSSTSTPPLSVQRLIEEAVGRESHEKLEGTEQYHCARCDRKVDAHKYVRILDMAVSDAVIEKQSGGGPPQLDSVGPSSSLKRSASATHNPSPPFLVVQLNRFAFNRKTLSRDKVCTPTDVPFFVSIPATQNVKPASEAEASSVDHCVQYKLVAVVVHSGSSLSCGHYYSFVTEPPHPPQQQQGPEGSTASPTGTASTTSTTEQQQQPAVPMSSWYLCNDDEVSLHTTVAPMATPPLLPLQEDAAVNERDDGKLSAPGTAINATPSATAMATEPYPAPSSLNTSRFGRADETPYLLFYERHDGQPSANMGDSSRPGCRSDLGVALGDTGTALDDAAVVPELPGFVEEILVARVNNRSRVDTSSSNITSSSRQKQQSQNRYYQQAGSNRRDGFGDGDDDDNLPPSASAGGGWGHNGNLVL